MKDYLPQNIKMLIFDVDGGIKDVKPTAEYVGKKLLLSQLPFHPLRFYKGYKGAKEVRKLQKNMGLKARHTVYKSSLKWLVII